MSKTVIHTPKAPAAIGAYSQAIRTGNTVYLSGQIPLAPETMQLVGDDFEAQAHQVFKNLRAVCETAGGSLNDIVKLNAYLTDLSHFATFNAVMDNTSLSPTLLAPPLASPRCHAAHWWKPKPFWFCLDVMPKP